MHLRSSRYLLALSLLIGLAATPALAQDRKALPPAAAAPGSAHRVVVSNRSPRTIEQVLISTSTEAEWGSDLLGTDVIETGRQVAVNYIGDCRADVQIVFEGGAMEARRRVDVCQNSTLTITPGWTLSPNLGARN